MRVHTFSRLGLLALCGLWLLLGVSAEDPVYCTERGERSYNCQPYSCNCQTCHSCGCETLAPWESCHHGGCSSCWCSPVCKCCYTDDCQYSCNCATCYHTCTEVVCTSNVSYHINSIAPQVGRTDGGTAVVVTGGTFINTGSLKCRFGSNVVNAEFVSATRLRCTAPSVTSTTTRYGVHVSVSLDGGTSWTNNQVDFTYYQCLGTPWCSNHGQCNAADASCTCDRGYWGAMCDQTCVGGTSNPCSNHSVATSDDRGCNADGTCTCAYGWWGPDCSNECAGGANTPCNGHGTCNVADGSCLCDPTHVGVACEYAGQCSDNVSHTNCHCAEPGKWGPACENDCPGGPAAPCGNHGRCDSSGSCLCNAGWYGANCTMECPGGASNPCSNHSFGSCSAEGTCQCASGYWGNACENVCPTHASSPSVPCSGHGRCSSTGICSCDPGFVGDACQIECAGYTQATGVCSGNGQCSVVDGSCSCEAGFFREDCSGQCPGLCTNTTNGICQASGDCRCNPGFYGDDCSQTCPVGPQQQPCNSHGTCNAGSCICDTFYYGDVCTPCPGLISVTGGFQAPCNNHGTCNGTGVCTCNAGWIGDACDVQVCLFNCKNGGYCSADTGFVCECKHGWTGSDCSERFHAGTVEFSTRTMMVQESDTPVDVVVRRHGGDAGAVSATIGSRDLTALNGLGRDFELQDVHVAWEDGDDADKIVRLMVFEDHVEEDNEHFVLNFVNITGGAQPGPNQTISVVVVGQSQNHTVISILVRLTLSVSEINSIDGFNQGFLKNVGIAIATSVNRLQVVSIVPDPKDAFTASTLQFQILPATGPGEVDVEVLAERFLLEAKNTSSILYDRTASVYSKYVDYRTAPFIYGQASASDPIVDPSSSGGSRTGVIVGSILGVLVILAVCGAFMYKKRTQITEWLLWKLGNFRFRTLQHEAKEQAQQMGATETETEKDSMYAGPQSDEMGNEAMSSMPMGDDDSAL